MKRKKKKKKTCSTTRLSQRVYKRDFCSHVFANPDRYTLVQYFQSLYRNEDIYELEGVHIANFEVDIF